MDNNILKTYNKPVEKILTQGLEFSADNLIFSA